ncbi:MAG: divalent-cation tolerance protein CutA [Elainellaceae cyanobacterium]
MTDQLDSSNAFVTAEGTYGVVMVTAPSQEEASAIAHALIKAQIAACVSMMPIQSIYTWKGEIQTDHEWQLFIKTDLSKFTTLEAKVQELHSYEVPEIIAIPILRGSQPYLRWINEQVIGH